MTTDLRGKRALITGASRGVGAVVAETVAQRGAALGRRAVLVQADITVSQDVARMMKEAEEALGGLEKD